MEAISMKALTREEVLAVSQELERQSKTKHDIITAGKDISTALVDNQVKACVNFGDLGVVPLDIGTVAHRQFSEKFGVDWRYYQRMQEEAQDLLTVNLNYWFQHSPKNYLLRVLDDRVRAVLSDRYRTLDNVDLFFEAFRVAQIVGAEVTRVDLTEERFYMRLIHWDWRERIDLQRQYGRIAKDNGFGDDEGGWPVVPGCIVSNSEVGSGGLMVEPFIYSLICMNGLVTDRTMRKYHLGRQQDMGFLSQETRDTEDRLVWLQVRDTITSVFDQDEFKKMVTALFESTNEELVNPIEAVDIVAKNYGLSDEDKQAILNELVSPSQEVDPGRTTFGLIQAVTRVGRDKENYNHGIAYERIGGELLGKAHELVEVRRR